MHTGTIAVALGILASSSVLAATPADFRFKSSASCGGRQGFHEQKISLSRRLNGALRARIVLTSDCFEEISSPHVDYLEDHVRLRVDMTSDGTITTSCICTNTLSFTLLKHVPRGTHVSFGFGSYEPNLWTVAP